MPTPDNAPALNAAEIRDLVKSMSQQELAIFRDVVREIRDIGSGISQPTIESLAKKYADKATKLAGNGGGE